MFVECKLFNRKLIDFYPLRPTKSATLQTVRMINKFAFEFIGCWIIMTGVRWHHRRWAVMAVPLDSWHFIPRFMRHLRRGPTTSSRTSTATTVPCPSIPKSFRYVSGLVDPAHRQERPFRLKIVSHISHLRNAVSPRTWHPHTYVHAIL